MQLLITNVSYIEAGQSLLGTVLPERRIALLFNGKYTFAATADFLKNSRAEQRAAIAEAAEADEAIQFNMAQLDAAYNYLSNELDYWFAGKPPRLQTELL